MANTKTKQIWFCVIVTLIVVVASLSLFVQQRLSQVDAGVCVEQGRVLSKEELRQAVLQSYIDILTENIRIHYYKISKSESGDRFTFIRNPKETNIRKLIDQAYRSDKSLRENFGIEVLHPDQILRVTELQEPFIFAGGNYFQVSTDIQPLDDFSLINHFWIFGLGRQYNISFHDRLRGFGKNYFIFPFSMFNSECCGKEFPKNLTQEEQFIRKEKAFREGIATHTKFVPISNCGKLLTTDNPEMDIAGGGGYFGFSYIIWLMLRAG